MEVKFQPFRTADYFVRTGAPVTESFIRSALAELKAPRTLQERNIAQLTLAERLHRQLDGELTLLSCVEAIAPLYAARFPLMRRHFSH